MAFRQSPAPELLTFRNWYTVVDRAPDGSDIDDGNAVRVFRVARGTARVQRFGGLQNAAGHAPRTEAQWRVGMLG